MHIHQPASCAVLCFLVLYCAFLIANGLEDFEVEDRGWVAGMRADNHEGEKESALFAQQAQHDRQL